MDSLCQTVFFAKVSANLMNNPKSLFNCFFAVRIDQAAGGKTKLQKSKALSHCMHSAGAVNSKPHQVAAGTS